MVHLLAPTLTRLGVFAAHPAAFAVLLCYVGAWLVLNPHSFDWHAFATVATWLMTLFIQRAEHRDTQAIHAKLDELLRVEGRARSELTQLDDEEPEVIEQHRSEERNGRSGPNDPTTRTKVEGHAPNQSTAAAKWPRPNLAPIPPTPR
jgi:low affinity Fe/Cu permease